MKHRKTLMFVAMLPLLAGFYGCQQEAAENVSSQPATAAVTAKPLPAVANAGATSPGKPSAPISMDYEVMGNPVVGAPVSINLSIKSAGGQGPVQVQYSISDRSSMSFQRGQVERVEIAEKPGDEIRQIAVIPQREGRLYLNVSAEIQTVNGSMIKSMAIPIQVGSAPDKQQNNGTLVEGPDGETVISMPAKEN